MTEENSFAGEATAYGSGREKRVQHTFRELLVLGHYETKRGQGTTLKKMTLALETEHKLARTS